MYKATTLPARAAEMQSFLCGIGGDADMFRALTSMIGDLSFFAIIVWCDHGWGIRTERTMMVFVADPERRKGVGHHLVEMMLAAPLLHDGFAPGAPFVWQGTETSIMFWKRFGDRVRPVNDLSSLPVDAP